jgi:hypothetical protein
MGQLNQPTYMYNEERQKQNSEEDGCHQYRSEAGSSKTGNF